MLDWIEIKDKLPEECEPVLAFVNGGMYVMHIDPFGFWHDYNGDLFGDIPACWMPLPEPPNA